MFNPLERKKYDKSMKEIQIFEETRTEYSYVYRMASYSPVFFISERDTVNKKFKFMHNGGMYCYTSSIGNDVRISRLNYVNYNENSFIRR